MTAAESRRLIVLLASLSAFGPLAIDLYLPALPSMADGLAATPEAVEASVAVFLGGFALGMLFYGPISDHYGRRRVVLGGIALFTLASLGCMATDSVGHLIAARFIQAIGGGAASVLARAVVQDVYKDSEAIQKLSLMGMVMAVAPVVAPLLGSLILLVSGWRGTFGALFAWGVLSLALVSKFLPESLPPERRNQHSLGRAFAAYGALCRDPVAVSLALIGGMSVAAMFAYITAGPFYFIHLRHFTPTAYSVVFAINAFGIFLASFLNSRLLPRFGAERLIGWCCALALASALLLLACVDLANGLPAAVFGLFLVVSMIGPLGANCVGLLMRNYPRNAGAASAFFGAAQFVFGTLASMAVSYFYNGSGRPMAGVVLIASALSMLGYWLFRRTRR
jgi:DHA1 family bicyclomycin/chloramphenicol resistance-like MFS transporter